MTESVVHMVTASPTKVMVFGASQRGNSVVSQFQKCLRSKVSVSEQPSDLYTCSFSISRCREERTLFILAGPWKERSCL